MKDECYHLQDKERTNNGSLGKMFHDFRELIKPCPNERAPNRFEEDGSLIRN